MAANRAAQNRKIRQEALREKLVAGGHLQHIVEIAEQLNNSDLDDKDVRRLKAKADIHLSLIKKYLPDIKAVELTGEGGGDLEVVIASFKDIKPDDLA